MMSVILTSFFLLITFLYQGSFTSFKIVLTIAIALLPLINLDKYNYLKSPKIIFLILFIWIIYFSFSLLLGIYNGFPYPDIRFITRWYLLLPLSFLIGHFFYKNINNQLILKIIEYITLIILIFSVIFLILEYYQLTSYFRFIYPADSFSGLVALEEKLQFRQSNQVSFTFLIPANIFIFYLKNKDFKYFPYLSCFNILFGSVITFISGRRALQYSVGLILFFFLFKSIFYILKKGKVNCTVFKNFFLRKEFYFFKSIFLIFVITIISFLFKNLLDLYAESNLFEAFFSTIFAPLDFMKDDGTFVRITQGISLIDGWLESPIIGNGLNSHSFSIIRDAEKPWSYELFYLALLFQTGIVGFTIFISTIYLTLFGLSIPLINRSNYHKKFYFVLPFSIIIFFVGAATNPFWDNMAIWSLIFYSGLQINSSNS